MEQNQELANTNKDKDILSIDIYTINKRRMKSLSYLRNSLNLHTILEFLEPSDKLILCNVNKIFRTTIELSNKDKNIAIYKMVLFNVSILNTK